MSDVLDNLIREDSTFSEAKFKSKVDNVFIKLYTGVMKQDLENIIKLQKIRENIFLVIKM